MSRTLPPSAEPVIRVAEALGPLLPEVVFLGGAILPLLLTDPAAPPARGTEDVDVVLESHSRVHYYRFESALRERGFRNDSSDGAPVCRWIVQGIKLDVMPVDPVILGFSNPWYPEALSSAVPMELAPGITIRLASSAAFLATKFAAFLDPRRGGGDFVASRDLEDILSLVDGRPELDGEIRTASPTLRAFLGKTIADLLHQRRFLDALPGHFPGDGAGQARIPRMETLLRIWARDFSAEAPA
jgi:hypothetical protein